MGNQPTKSSARRSTKSSARRSTTSSARRTRTISTSASDSDSTSASTSAFYGQQVDSANIGSSSTSYGPQLGSANFGSSTSYGQQFGSANFESSSDFYGQQLGSAIFGSYPTSYGQQVDSANIGSSSTSYGQQLGSANFGSSTSYGQQFGSANFESSSDFYGQQLGSAIFGSSSTSYDQQVDFANFGSSSASYGQQQLDNANFWPSYVFDDGQPDSADYYFKKKKKDSSNFGCEHYRRKCRIRAPCCDRVFQCRLCHDEAMNSLEVDPTHRHDLPRHQIIKVICSCCNTEQKVRQKCKSCGVCMGNYFCAKCKFFDDDVSKEQFHCDGCGICRTGGKDNFFHCDNCGCCFSKELLDTHRCVERAMHNDCPICYEYLFDSRKALTKLRCGHTIHIECVEEMERHSQYACPLCLKSATDMSETWRQFDQEVARTHPQNDFWNMNVYVPILCNDCGERSQAVFHEVGLKCSRCHSYNTRQI